ncbi:UNVERIFIED_CONTAM: Purple acid phosphatase 18 [Sesamum angustifolium]|uniref:Purple acid phosphatase n=1 Tax=Sesamum angustifolium TaxID=2727405 RepID=A0AAW2KVF4_9LAMI
MMQQPGGMARPEMPMEQQQPPQQQQYPAQQWMMMPPQAPQHQPVQPQPQPQPPQFWAQQQQQQHYGAGPTNAASGGAGGGADEVRSLWIGDLQYWMDENYLTSCFYHTGELVSAKIIRNKQTGQSEGYGFLEFRTHATAENILQTYNGAMMPNADQTFRLNWASLGAGDKRADDSPEHTIFVGDLAGDVTDYVLQETFKAVYQSVKGAKVVTDRVTGRSKGYGFVKFGDEREQQRAMTEMNGVLCSTRPMRIGPAANKKPMTASTQKASYQNPQGTQGESDPNNTTVFVGGLDPNVTDDHLKQVFSQYGEVVHVKIPVGKRCGFVQFADRSCAEQALSNLNGTLLGGQNIRLSWGRNPSNKQSDQNQWGGAYYGYTQGYESYGGYAPPQDPNMYYGGYPGYANYQQPQQWYEKLLLKSYHSSPVKRIAQFIMELKLILLLLLAVVATADYVRPPPRKTLSFPWSKKPSSLPQQVHISLAGDKHMRITWVTNDKHSPSIVEYGTSPNNYSFSSEGEYTSYSYMLYSSGKIHHVVIVHWKMIPRQTGWTKSTLDHIDQCKYDVHMLPGDLSYADYIQRRWDTFGELVQPLASARPWMVTQGNHEKEHIPLLEDSFVSYNSRWKMPYEESASSSNLYYSFEVTGVHVIMLGSYTDYDEYSDQYAWLKADLSKVDRKRTPWLIVLFHVPWYNSNEAHQGEGDDMKTTMEPLLYAAGVDIVFAGHVHAYERSSRVYNGKSDPCGAVHITIGDGGNREGLARKYKEPKPEWSVFREASFGHGELKIVNSTHAFWSWHRNDDDEPVRSDQFWITSLFGSSCLAENGPELRKMLLEP